jgi:serine phosphatase RsbU (regulator of sigma subunit)
MRLFRSLRVKFVLYFVGFMTASMLLLAKSLFDHEHDALLLELQKRSSIEAQNLGLQSREALETNDDLMLVTTLRGLRSMDDFVFAAVLYPDGTIFAHSDVRQVGQRLEVPSDVRALQQRQTSRELHAGGGPPRIQVWTPVLSTLRGQPERIGFVCLEVSKEPLLAAVDQAKLSATRVGALFAVLGLVGTALIAQTVTKPIGKLVHAVQRIAAGDLEHKVNLRRADEIGILSQSFDQMTDELQRAQQELLKQQLYEKELEVAGKIQAALLPSGPPQVDGYAVAALSVPARVVGGDFYDYVPLRDGRTAFLVADVAGKGVSAGLVMAAARSAARSTFAYTSSPHEALVALNEQLLRDFDRTTFVTMLCMVLDEQRNRLDIANAGHPPVLWCHAAGGVELLRMRGAALGILPEERFGDILEAAEVQLEAGDLVLGYSDGVNETHDVQGRLFGEVRLQQFGTAHARLDPQRFLDRLRAELETFSRGFGQFDDITALALKAVTQRSRAPQATPLAGGSIAGQRGA